MPVVVLSDSLKNHHAAPTYTKKRLSSRMLEKKALFDRLWLRSPEQFCNNSMWGKERLKRTQLLLDTLPSEGKVLDLGCGWGDMLTYCHERGFSVEGAEISKNAIRCLSPTEFPIHLAQLPFTSLPDKQYDIILCLDTLEELEPKEYRLCFSELSRLLKPGGYLLASVNLDPHSSSPHKKFIQLAETEFDTIEHRLSYLRFHEKFMKRESTLFPSLLYCLESFAKWILKDRAASHLIYLGRKRPLISSLT